MRLLARLALPVMAFFALTTPVVAQDCEVLAARAAVSEGVPAELLPAIARMESGHSLDGGPRRAWPWTLNQGGRGMFFDTKAEAMAYLTEAVANGVTNIDVGCMQINYRWHHDQFASLDEMMDPVANTRYAARFLSDMHDRLGSWTEATRQYHSMDPERGAAYQVRVARIQGQITGGDETFADAAASPGQSVGFNGALGRPFIDIGQMQLSSAAPPADDLVLPPLDESVLVLVIAANADREERNVLSPRLQRDLDKIEEMRAVLALPG